MRRVFDKVRSLTSASEEREIVGDLRFIAKLVSGSGIVEPIPGFLFCNGAPISRTTYKRLFDLIGTAYGAGDGSTTFNLPDYRGRFLAGATDNAVAANQINSLLRGGVLGAEAIALGKANIPRHTHTPGTISIGSGSGSHTHGPNWTVTTSVEISIDYGWWRVSAGPGLRSFDSGGLTAATHSHPSGELSGSTENGGAAGLAGTAHQNVHPHQGIGGILVAY